MKPLKVSDINRYIKRILSTDPILSNLSVEGEVSNYKRHISGNIYFSLKDKTSKLKCVMFSSDALDFDLDINDGDNVIVKGNLSVYERDGTYQLYVKSIEKQGLGELHIAFEKLKKSMEKKGIFDDKYKKALPYLPKKIGVVTSATGAAVQDIINVTRRRFPLIDMLIYPVLVQGVLSAQSICYALEYLENREDVDLIIVARGGGSIEELWSFNEEKVVQTVFNMNTPVISAVGHETDFTLIDFVADLRAPTPSAAGELAVPQYYEISYKLDDIFDSMKNSMDNKLEKQQIVIENAYNVLKLNNPVNKVNNYNEQLKWQYEKLQSGILKTVESRYKKLDLESVRLESFSPLATLKRGYSVIQDENNSCIGSINELRKDQVIRVVMKDGNASAKIIDRRNTDD